MLCTTAQDGRSSRLYCVHVPVRRDYNDNYKVLCTDYGHSQIHENRMSREPWSFGERGRGTQSLGVWFSPVVGEQKNTMK